MPLGYLHGPPRLAEDPALPAPFSRSELLVIVACAISMLIVQMDWFALNLALPAIARRFRVPPTDLQWVISGYMLSIGALMVTAGRLADIFGRRRIIVADEGLTLHHHCYTENCAAAVVLGQVFASDPALVREPVLRLFQQEISMQPLPQPLETEKHS